MLRFILFSGFLILAGLMRCSKYPDLGEGYHLDSDGEYDLQIVNSQNTVLVENHILDYAFDSTFIIAAQRPWDSIPNRSEMKYNEANTAFEESKFIQYWIINKGLETNYGYDEVRERATYSNIYGPFQKEEYLLKRKELDVPNSLHLEEE